jgi:hypothetical protein
MPESPPVSGANFYNHMPPADHRTGDIWSGLPTFSLLNSEVVSGVIITPACDLEKRKCETATYLPIVSVKDYLVSPAFRYECWLEMVPLLSKLPNFGAILPPARYELIPKADFDALVGDYSDANGRLLSSNEITRLKSYEAYLVGSYCGKAEFESLSGFIKADRYTTLIGKLITNALKADIHFLPYDGQPTQYSAVSSHSVVLFRYPLNVPIEILRRAQNMTQSQWENSKEEFKINMPVVQHMKQWPIKLASLRNEFLGDLISRYLNMYIRLGSPDFSDESVRSMSRDIGGHL